MTGVLVLLGWCALTASPGLALLVQERMRPLAFADLVGTLFTVLLWLLLIAGWVPFFGDAWQEASVWLNLAIGLAALNLGLAFSCLLFLPAPRSTPPRGARIIALASFWCAVVIIAAAGSNDRFLYGMTFSAPLVGLTVGLVILALASALVVLLTSQRQTPGA